MKSLLQVIIVLGLIIIPNTIQASFDTVGYSEMFSKAISDSKPSYCAKIKNNQSEKDMCYLRLSTMLEEPKLCKKIKTKDTQNACNAEMAGLTGDFSYCRGLDHRYPQCYDTEKKMNTSSFVNFEIEGTDKILKSSKKKQKIGTLSVNTPNSTAGIKSFSLMFKGVDSVPPLTEVWLQSKNKKLDQNFYRSELNNAYYRNTIQFQIDFAQSEKITTQKKTYDIWGTLNGNKAGSFLLENGGIGGYWDVAPTYNHDTTGVIFYE